MRALLAGLLLYSVSAEAQPKVVMGFVACSPENECSYHELEAPSMQQCMLYGQLAFLDWTRRTNRDGWTLRRYQCLIRPDETPA